MSIGAFGGALVRGLVARDGLPAPNLVLAGGRQHTAETIWRAWAQNKSPHTVSAYYNDLEDFAVFFSRALGISPRLTPLQALTKLFQQSAPSANEIAIHFQAYLQGAHLAPATINRHLCTLRSLTKLARMLGLITWMIEVSGVRHEQRRSTLGPTVAEVRRMLAVVSDDTEADTRDAAIVTVFFCLGLRVAELCTLNLEDVNLTRATRDPSRTSARDAERASDRADARGARRAARLVSWVAPFRQLLTGPILFTPFVDERGRSGIRFEGRVGLSALLGGELVTRLASPSILSWNQIAEFLGNMRQLRESIGSAA